MKFPTRLRPSSWSEERRRYLSVFGIGFCCLFLALLSLILLDRGYFIYYGDYVSQQIPFYELANDAVRSGSFGWNWYTDLGTSFIGSYSFYLLGSPFFWLSTILPRSWVIYSMPVLLAMKHGIAALTGYAYIRRFVRNPNAAVVGGLLYAFSGFQLFNIFFNHFQDVTAFFPLTLIAMEELVNNNRRGVFALSVGLMACINYFFFTGQVVFLVLYFALRCTSKDFHATFRKFWVVLFEAVVGVLLACVILLPSAVVVLANSRSTTRLYGLDMVSYSDRTRLWRILYGLFMIPDVPARPNLFSSDNAKWASIGGYLPMFSMAGVITFLKEKKGHWARRLTIICAVCACIPVLNSAFYALNSSYYARWFYMPVLLLALMTAYVLDNRQMDWRFGFLFTSAMMLIFAVISLLPKKEDGEVTWFSFAEHPYFFYITLAICVLGLAATMLVLRLRRRRRHVKDFYKAAISLTALFSLGCTLAVVLFGAYEPSRALEYIDKAIDPENEISDLVSVSEDDFFRVDISENRDNYPMFWGLPNMRCFHSVVSSSIMDFYDRLDITRDVASRVDLDAYALRGLFSVKYYFDEQPATQYKAGIDPDALPEVPTIELPGFEYVTTASGFHIFYNTAYVPMGFTFDYFITHYQWEEMEASDRASILIRALVLTDEQQEKYAPNLLNIDGDYLQLDENDYLEECANRAAHACDTFTYDSYGFTATINTQNENLVFFSVPYDDGWSATVNGEPVEVQKVDEGFMAVPVAAGDNEIVFRYETPGLRAGVMLTGTGLVVLIVYMLLCRRFCEMPPKDKRVLTVDYTREAAFLEEKTAPQNGSGKQAEGASNNSPKDRGDVLDVPKDGSGVKSEKQPVSAKQSGGQKRKKRKRPSGR